MKIRFLNRIFVLFIALLSFFSCKKNGESIDPVLIVSPSNVSFEQEGGVATVSIECNDEWKIYNSAPDWIKMSQDKGTSGNVTLSLTIGINNSGVSRTGVLSINSANGQSTRVVVKQEIRLYPSYNTSPQEPNATGMSSNAVELAAKMELGINIGNTLEAPGGENGWEGNNQGWNTMITKEYVDLLKTSGFNAVRLPCSWNMKHLSDIKNAKIDSKWMNRVKEVIGYCIDNDMYVLLNIHWDGGWLENHCTVEKKDSVNAKQKALWEQIATAMRDFDEHLIFASANEPDASNVEEMEVLLSYHQTFVDAVRSTGGRNTYRCLVIQGDAELLGVDNFPLDPTPKRMMYESHNYTPYQFTTLSSDENWGKMFYYWGKGHHSTIEPDRNADWGEEDEQQKGFNMLKANFVDKGIPVLMGEYGAYRRGGKTNEPKDLETHNDAVDYWITYVTEQAISRGIVPFFWETGEVFNRSAATVLDQRSLDAIIAGGN